MSCLKLAFLLLVIELVVQSSAYPTGPPLGVCQSMVPGHGPSAQTSTAPYTVSMNSSTLTAGAVYAVTVTATGGTAYRGVFVQARPVGCNPANPQISRGQFSLLPGETYLQTLDCNSNTASAVGHSNNNDTTTSTFYWTAPQGVSTDMQFVATFVQTRPVFWTGVTSPRLQYANAPADCENTGSTAKFSVFSFVAMLFGMLFI